MEVFRGLKSFQHPSVFAGRSSLRSFSVWVPLMFGSSATLIGKDCRHGLAYVRWSGAEYLLVWGCSGLPL